MRPKTQMNKADPLIFNKPGTVFIDDRDLENHAGRSYLFTDPEHLITADRPEQILSALERMDRDLGLGFFLAGYIAYEAGLGLDKPIPARCRNSLPLLYFGAYRGFEEFDSERLELEGQGPEPDLANVRLSISEDEFLARVDEIKKYISAGDIYQINFTCKLLFENDGTGSCLFFRLRAAHPVCHSAFINTGDARIISLSPELFLRREGNRVLTRPMKGTIRRGRWFEEDEKFREQLADSEKDRAENLMILDLMRNDLGRVCELGSVQAPVIFKTEQYHSLFQMTSQAQGILKPGGSVSEMLRAAFPAGSITGAPKIRAMEVIAELEPQARSLYTGSLGYIGFDGRADLNIVIRTILIKNGTAHFHVGGGIVADSDPEAEYEETLIKGRALKEVLFE